MTPAASESYFSATTLLWLVVSIMAALMLVKSLNHRRTRLTKTLKNYVERNQGGSIPSNSSETPPSDSETPPD